jgi:hypothetical protein
MPGLVPGIHVFLWSQDVDGRDKPGQDDQLNQCAASGVALLLFAPLHLGRDQAFKPIGERPGVLLRKLLSHTFDRWFYAHTYRNFARFRPRLFHQSISGTIDAGDLARRPLAPIQSQRA